MGGSLLAEAGCPSWDTPGLHGSFRCLLSWSLSTTNCRRPPAERCRHSSPRASLREPLREPPLALQLPPASSARWLEPLVLSPERLVVRKPVDVSQRLSEGKTFRSHCSKISSPFWVLCRLCDSLHK